MWMRHLDWFTALPLLCLCRKSFFLFSVPERKIMEQVTYNYRSTINNLQIDNKRKQSVSNWCWGLCFSFLAPLIMMPSKREFRALVIEMVLATDMSCHFQQIKAMKNALQQPEGWVTSQHCSERLHFSWCFAIVFDFKSTSPDVLALFDGHINSLSAVEFWMNSLRVELHPPIHTSLFCAGGPKLAKVTMLG